MIYFPPILDHIFNSNCKNEVLNQGVQSGKTFSPLYLTYCLHVIEFGDVIILRHRLQRL
jgi:hypothetical protein